MTSPKHLWSGDWEHESAALSEDLAGRGPSALEPAPATEPPPARPPESPRPAPRRPVPRLSPALAIALATILVLAAAGFGISRLVGASSSSADGSASVSQASGPIDWLGMQIEGIQPGTVVIATVAPGSAGERAGLEPGDVLTTVNGRPINATGDIGSAISGLRPGDGVTIQVSRGSTRLSTRAMLGAPPSNHP